jgi:transcription antitermination factor NusG
VKKDDVQLGMVVKFVSGKWAGAAGVVTGFNESTGRVKVQVSGIVNSEPVSFERYFPCEQLEENR